MPIKTVCESSGAIIFIPTKAEQKAKQTQDRLERLANEMEHELALIKQLREGLEAQADSSK